MEVRLEVIECDAHCYAGSTAGASEVVCLSQPVGSISHRQKQGAGAGVGEEICDGSGGSQQAAISVQTADH